MDIKRPNIYQNARKSAGLTQERASEKLGISVESIRAYETGLRLPPNEVVDLMVICYDAQFLAYQHIRESAELNRNTLPDVEAVPLSQAIMHLLQQIYAFADNHRDRDLISIGADGKISDDERALFDAINAELEEIVSAAMSVRYAQTSE